MQSKLKTSSTSTSTSTSSSLLQSSQLSSCED